MNPLPSPRLEILPKTRKGSSVVSTVATRKGAAQIIERGVLRFRVYTQTRPIVNRKSEIKNYTLHTLSYRLNGRRQRVVRADMADIHRAIEEAETAIANGQTDLLSFSSANRARWQDLERRAAAVGATPEEIFALGLEAHAKNSRAKIVRKNCPEIVEEFLESRRKIKSKWKRILAGMCERIARHFTGPLTAYTSRDFESFLDKLATGSLPVGTRTRKNYRDALQSIIHYARKKYVPADFDPLQEVAEVEVITADVKPYQPETLAYWLNFCEGYDAGKKLVPLMCITAFAYVRHGEMNEEDKASALDWKNIRFKTKRIFIPGDVAKQTTRASGNARVVDMPDNLIAWLQPYAKTSGKICDLVQSGNAMSRSRQKAAAAALKEAAACANREQADRLRAIAADLSGNRRNALRKSCISYQKALTRDIASVADSAGNSPGIIKATYLHVDEEMKETAERWFAIRPQRALDLPLFTYGKV